MNNSTPVDDPNYVELDMISDMVEEYEDVHYPIGRYLSRKLNINSAFVFGV